MVSVSITYLYGAKTSLIEAHKDNYVTTAILTSFYIKKDDILFECAKYALQILPGTELNLEKKLSLLERYTDHMKDTARIRVLIEENVLQRINNSTYKVNESVKNEICMEIKALESWFENYRMTQ